MDLEEFAILEEALVAGYKRRCVFETRAASKNNGILTKELVNEAREYSADELKRKYNLIQYIQHLV